ncbi:MAG: hypothetical protein FJX65_02785 [Alphaproteobacteria bacterium]|nr:hypothetical protein [Alphaproteobacteria bacterium]
MAPKKNPLKLNPLQLKTLALVQELAGLPDNGRKDATSGNIALQWLPNPHGDHFHVGSAVVMGRDATGLHNQSVWVALSRKGLTAIGERGEVAITPAGMAYDTGVRDQILMRSDHEGH